MKIRTALVWATAAALLLALASSPIDAAKRTRRAARNAEDGKQVELFAAEKAGEIEVTFIPKDATEANVLIKNKTDKPLTVKLPEAFAGVPLAQFGGGGLGGGGLGGGLGGGGLGGGLGGGGGGQGLGGGFGGGGGLGGGGFGGGGLGGGGFGGGGGFFNVAPEKTGKIKVSCLCLEHGKTDPSPRMKYKLVPIETFTKDQQVIEICKMLARGEVPQNAAQAATWHLTNKLSWNELAAKNRVELRTIGYAEKFFTPRELAFAMRIVGEATERAKKVPRSESETSPGQLEQQASSNRVQTP